MKIADGVYAIGQREGFQGFASGYVNAYLLEEENGDLTLIDTLYETDPRLIIDQLVRMDRTYTDLKRILLTHGHRSHLGGLRFLWDQSDAETYAHEYEADIIAGQRGAQPVTVRPMPPWSLYPQRLGLALGLGGHPPCPVDNHLKHDLDQRIEQIGPLEVIYTPGHTPGHLSFFWRDRGVLFTGDAVATWPTFGPGWPGYNLNPKQHQESIKRLVSYSDDVEVLAVSHGRPITRGAGARLRSLGVDKKE